LAVSHAVPAGSQESTVVFKFISERAEVVVVMEVVVVLIFFLGKRTWEKLQLSRPQYRLCLRSPKFAEDIIKDSHRHHGFNI
jgi:hypothetical protein